MESKELKKYTEKGLKCLRMDYIRKLAVESFKINVAGLEAQYPTKDTLKPLLVQAILMAQEEKVEKVKESVKKAASLADNEEFVEFLSLTAGDKYRLKSGKATGLVSVLGEFTLENGKKSLRVKIEATGKELEASWENYKVIRVK